MNASRPKILLVEDDEVLLDVLKDCVISMGGEPILASNGIEAFKVISTEKLDMVITDIQMPRMDGMKLMDVINGLEVKVPVVVMSGYSQYTDADVAKKNGAIFLAKPFSLEQIREVLSLYLTAV